MYKICMLVFPYSGNMTGNLYIVVIALTNVKYAVLTFGASAAVASARQLLCFCQLPSSHFTVASPNTLTVLPAATGVFTLT